MSGPQITTVIPTYRRPLLLKRAILSALQQTFPHLTVCVYDNASGDETERIVREIAEADSRVQYFQNKTNTGWLANFEQGIARVETPYYSMLSDDDILLPDFYEVTMKAFERYPQAGSSFSEFLVVNEKSEIIRSAHPPSDYRYYSPEEGACAMIDHTIPTPWTSIVLRSSIREAVGPIRGDDGVFMFRTFALFPTVFCPNIGSIVFSHPESGSSRFPVHGKSVVEECKKALQRVLEDKRIPRQIRGKAHIYFDPSTSRAAWNRFLHGMGIGDFEYATHASSDLIECGYVFRGRALLLLGRIIKVFRFLQKLIALIRQVHGFFRKRHIRNQSPSFERELQYLRELNERAGYMSKT